MSILYASATRCASPRKIRMQRTSMRSTLALIKPAIRPISCSRRRVLRLERLGLLSARLNRPVRLQPAAAVHQQTPAAGAPPPSVDAQTRRRRTPADAPPPPVAVRQQLWITASPHLPAAVRLQSLNLPAAVRIRRRPPRRFSNRASRSRSALKAAAAPR